MNLQAVKALVAQAVEPLRTRVRGLVRRAVLQSLDNSGGLLKGQVELTTDEIVGSVELISPPGVSIRPEGAELLVLAVGGNPSNLVGIPWIRGKRLTGNDLAAGEVALHIGNSGQMVRLKANGDVVITPGAGGQVYLGADGALKKVALAEDVEARLDTIKTAYNTHVHAGVTVGPGSTGTTPSVIPVLAPVGATKVKAE